MNECQERSPATPARAEGFSFGVQARDLSEGFQFGIPPVPAVQSGTIDFHRVKHLMSGKPLTRLRPLPRPERPFLAAGARPDELTEEEAGELKALSDLTPGTPGTLKIALVPIPDGDPSRIR